jgi:hypothetical protein
MSILDIADELAALIEPDPTLRDDTRVQPAAYEPDTLYLWPVREVYTPEDTGGNELQNVELRVAWAADRLGEGDPDRSVTDEVVARADALGQAIRGQRAGATYEQIALASVDYESLTGFDARGFIATLVGWVQRTD